MALTLKVLDSNAGQYELQQRLESAKQSILDEVHKRKSRGNLEDLSQKLTNLYYPTSGNAILNYADEFSTSAEVILEKVFNEFNFEENKGRSFYDPSQRIKVSTLKQAIDMQDNIINKLTNMLSSRVSLEELKDTINKANNIFNQGKILVQQVENEYMLTESSFMIGDSFLQAREIINAIRGLSIAANSNTLTLSQLGNEFEKSLAKINLMEEAENIVDEMLMEEQHKGSKTVSRGSGNLISYDVDISIDNINNLKKNGFKTQKGNAIFTYNPFEKKQGKMDVQLNFQDNLGQSDTFRISAKRWTTDYGSFGTTSIDAGITRSGGQTVAEAYKLALLSPNFDSYGSPNATISSGYAAHDFAKAALKADIIMGLSQDEGYANTLVIDTGSKIIVRDISSLIEKENLTINNYLSSNLDSLALAKYKILNSQTTDRTSSYLGLMTNSLNKMKVSINTKVLEI